MYVQHEKCMLARISIVLGLSHVIVVIFNDEGKELTEEDMR